MIGSIIKINAKIARLLPCTAHRIIACKKVVYGSDNLLPRQRSIAVQVIRPTCADGYFQVRRKHHKVELP